MAPIVPAEKVLPSPPPTWASVQQTGRDHARQSVPAPFKSEWRPQVAAIDDEMPTSSEAASHEGAPRYLAHELFEEEPVYGNFNATLWNSFIYLLRYLFIVILVGAPLAAPIIIYRNDWDAIDQQEDQVLALQEANLRFYVFCWLETFWLSLCFSHFLVKALPYAFFFGARYLNSAHRRYWRIFRTLKWPYTLLGGVLGGLISFKMFVQENEGLVANVGRTNVWDWRDTINDIQEQCLYWIIAYFLERTIILYISVHYHYRSDHGKILRGKKMEAALCALYDASTYLYHPYSQPTLEEDVLIHSHQMSEKGRKRKEAAKMLRRIGVAIDHAVTFTGRSIGADKDSHFWKANSTYATIEYALEDAASAEALAQRIWRSLVPMKHDALTANHIAEVLGPHRREEASRYFNILDENENRDIRLSEFVSTVVEMGRRRQATYQSMHDVDHAIATFHWVLLLVIAALMIYFIVVIYVPTIKTIKTELQFTSIGLAFAFGRTIHDFLSGAIFIFFKHAFDVGDRIDLFNLAESNSVSVIVRRISLLYVVFERVDDGKTVQFPTSRLTEKRIENLSRSGQNRETITLHIDFATPWHDVLQLRTELESFLCEGSNRRDFRPELDLRVAGVGGDMTKLELVARVIHRGNGADDALRAARSSRFLCALARACKRIPIQKPGGTGAKTGDEGKPSYSVLVSEDQAQRKRDAEELRAKKARVDYAEEETDEHTEEQKEGDLMASHHLSSAPDTRASTQAAFHEPGTQEQAREQGKKQAQKRREAEKRQREEAALVQLAEIPIAMQQRTRTGSTAVDRRARPGRRSLHIGELPLGLRRTPRSISAQVGGGDWWNVGTSL